jgi:hypothetical protein
VWQRVVSALVNWADDEFKAAGSAFSAERLSDVRYDRYSGSSSNATPESMVGYLPMGGRMRAGRDESY